MNGRTLAIVGGGPAGLMATEAARRASVPEALEIDLYESMPSPGRKFLMAGKGGMNITHAEPLPAFCARYGERRERLTPLLEAFGPEALREWMRGLGVESFVGSSGRVFPAGMKAAPLLRAWLHRLRSEAVRLHMRHRWMGLEALPDNRYALTFDTPQGRMRRVADALILALGGGSWPQLGSDGAWVERLTAFGLPVAPLRPANCGFTIGWSAPFAERHAGSPVKTVTAHVAGSPTPARRGEFIVTAEGVEGGLIYALAAPLRETIEQHGSATLTLDLLPDREISRVAAEVARPRGARSLSSHLRSRLGLPAVKVALLRECLPPETFNNPTALAAALKAMPLIVRAPRPLAEAISSAGGVRLEALDAKLMAHNHPGLFFAGEMLDWEAPTGGYLLTGCLASGRAAGEAAARFVAECVKSGR